MSNYFEDWLGFWLPIYKLQVFKAKLTKDINALLEIKENMYKNVHFSKEERIELLNKLEIYKLGGRNEEY